MSVRRYGSTFFAVRSFFRLTVELVLLQHKCGRKFAGTEQKPGSHLGGLQYQVPVVGKRTTTATQKARFLGPGPGSLDNTPGRTSDAGSLRLDNVERR